MKYSVVGCFAEDIVGVVFGLCVFVLGLKLNE
jgi:hypothetical protein